MMMSMKLRSLSAALTKARARTDSWQSNQEDVIAKNYDRAAEKFRKKNNLFDAFSSSTFPVRDATSSLGQLLPYALCIKTRRMLLFIKEHKDQSFGALEEDHTATKSLLSQKPMDTIRFLRTHSGRTVNILKNEFESCTYVQNAVEILRAPGRSKKKAIMVAVTESPDKMIALLREFPEDTYIVVARSPECFKHLLLKSLPRTTKLMMDNPVHAMELLCDLCFPELVQYLLQRPKGAMAVLTANCVGVVNFIHQYAESAIVMLLGRHEIDAVAFIRAHVDSMMHFLMDNVRPASRFFESQPRDAIAILIAHPINTLVFLCNNPAGTLAFLCKEGVAKSAVEVILDRNREDFMSFVAHNPNNVMSMLKQYPLEAQSIIGDGYEMLQPRNIKQFMDLVIGNENHLFDWMHRHPILAMRLLQKNPKQAVNLLAHLRDDVMELLRRHPFDALGIFWSRRNQAIQMLCKYRTRVVNLLVRYPTMLLELLLSSPKSAVANLLAANPMDTLTYMTNHFEDTIELLALQPKAFINILKINPRRTLALLAQYENAGDHDDVDASDEKLPEPTSVAEDESKRNATGQSMSVWEDSAGNEQDTFDGAYAEANSLRDRAHSETGQPRDNRHSSESETDTKSAARRHTWSHSSIENDLERSDDSSDESSSSSDDAHEPDRVISAERVESTSWSSSPARLSKMQRYRTKKPQFDSTQDELPDPPPRTKVSDNLGAEVPAAELAEETVVSPAGTRPDNDAIDGASSATRRNYSTLGPAKRDKVRRYDRGQLPELNAEEEQPENSASSSAAAADATAMPSFGTDHSRLPFLGANSNPPSWEHGDNLSDRPARTFDGNVAAAASPDYEPEHAPDSYVDDEVDTLSTSTYDKSRRSRHRVPDQDLSHTEASDNLSAEESADALDGPKSVSMSEPRSTSPLSESRDSWSTSRYGKSKGSRHRVSDRPSAPPRGNKPKVSNRSSAKFTAAGRSDDESVSSSKSGTVEHTSFSRPNPPVSRANKPKVSNRSRKRVTSISKPDLQEGVLPRKQRPKRVTSISKPDLQEGVLTRKQRPTPVFRRAPLAHGADDLSAPHRTKGLKRNKGLPGSGAHNRRKARRAQKSTAETIPMGDHFESKTTTVYESAAEDNDI